MKPHRHKLLWVGDAVCHTGFARVTSNVLSYLKDSWDVSVLGVNYSGDPHPYPYPIFPALSGGDVWGLGRFQAVLKLVCPDIVLIINDPWVVVDYLKIDSDYPKVAYMPVDALNIHPNVCVELNKLRSAIFYTDFGKRVVTTGGYRGPYTIVPHGVDTTMYAPMDKQSARENLGLANLIKDGFVFGNVNRNQPRKRLDLTIEYFANWVEKYNIPENVFLYLHCSQRDIGWDLPELAYHWGVDKRLIIPSNELTSSRGIKEESMKLVYNTFDVQITTTNGEGWSLPTVEGMACGIPQIVPDFAALGEWPGNAVMKIPCSNFTATAGNLNTVGAFPDREPFVDAMQRFYVSAEDRVCYGKMALEHVHQSCFDWKNIAAEFDAVLQLVLDSEKEEKVDVIKKERENRGDSARADRSASGRRAGRGKGRNWQR